MALIYVLLLIFISTCSAQSADPIFKFCNDDSKINSSTKVSANIDNILAELVSTINARDGFTIASQGKLDIGDHRVYGLAQCRGDLNRKDCLNCIQYASKEIRKRCPNQTDARIWYDYCFVRYDTRNFFGQLDTSVGVIYSQVTRKVTNPEIFNKRLGIMMDRMRSEAVMPGKKYFASGKSLLSPYSVLYASVQCTRDVSRVSCAQCLATAIQLFRRDCGHREACQVLFSTCRVRYEISLLL